MGDRSELSFSLDSSLGRLARWLRLLGHNTAWAPERSLRQALACARTEGRALLTRSGCLERLGLVRPRDGYLRIESERPRLQLIEVGKTWPIFPTASLFTRCSRCNTTLESAEPSWARPRVPPFVAKTQRRFHVCPDCMKIYWGATHAKAIADFLESVAAELGATCRRADR